MRPEIDPTTYVIGRRYRIQFSCADGNFGGVIEDVLVGIETYEALMTRSPETWKEIVGQLRFLHSEIGPPDGVQIEELETVSEMRPEMPSKPVN